MEFYSNNENPSFCKPYLQKRVQLITALRNSLFSPRDTNPLHCLTQARGCCLIGVQEATHLNPPRQFQEGQRQDVWHRTRICLAAADPCAFAVFTVIKIVTSDWKKYFNRKE